MTIRTYSEDSLIDALVHQSYPTGHVLTVTELYGSMSQALIEQFELQVSALLGEDLNKICPLWACEEILVMELPSRAIADALMTTYQETMNMRYYRDGKFVCEN